MPNKNNGLFKLSAVFLAMLPALLSGLNNKAQARDFFDPSFISSLNGSDPSTTPDLSIFQTQNAQAPGDYRVDIMFNGMAYGLKPFPNWSRIKTAAPIFQSSRIPKRISTLPSSA